MNNFHNAADFHIIRGGEAGLLTSDHPLEVVSAPEDPTVSQRLRELERFRALLDQSSEVILLALWPSGMIVDINASARQQTGCCLEKMEQRHLADFLAVESYRQVCAVIDQQNENQAEGGGIISSAYLRQSKGSTLPVELSARRVCLEEIEYVVIVARDTRERQAAEKALRESEARFRLMAEGVSDGIIIVENGTITFANQRSARILGRSHAELMQMRFSDLAEPEDRERLERLEELIHHEIDDQVDLEFWISRPGGEPACVLFQAALIRHEGFHTGWYIVISDITERVEREREGQAVAAMVKALGTAQSQEEMGQIILRQVLGLRRVESASLVIRQKGKKDLLIENAAEIWNYENTACLPLVSYDETIGELWAAAQRPFSAGELRTMSTLAEAAANALQRMLLHQETQRRVQRLDALRSIDMTITASLDIRVTLDILLNQALSHLGVDAASVLLYRPHTRMLEFACGQGFRARHPELKSLQPLFDLVGQATLNRQIISFNHHSQEWQRSGRALMFKQEGFVFYTAAPLVAKGEIKGVLELFHRSPLEPDQEWRDFLEALAMQAAIAIDNTELFDGLQRSNMELRVAYDTTLEGWVKTLDLRDRETEAHTQRVTSLTQQLAGLLGVRDLDLVNIGRGALLHDIGKMAIPDAILRKPGPLSDQEWVEMRRHPEYARELLWPIPYLRPALDIPYCHHERWDGSGYPRGLKGEAIPVAARIFAVVDVWDALSSDRPYRAAWSEEKVLEYIQEQAGKQFDPEVVRVFLQFKKDNF